MKKYRQDHKGSNRQTLLNVAQPEELMKFLIEQMPDKSRNNIKSLLSHRQVLVDGQVVTKYNHPVKVGQKVSINWALVRDEKPVRGLQILYEDADIIIIDKPAGLLSIASDKEKERTAYHQLTEYVRTKDPENRIFIVHRLDRETSGVMLFAKNEDIKHSLQDNWKEAVVDRAYIAVVEGQVEKKEGKIRSWLQETKTRLVYSSSSPGEGQEAVTCYKVLETGAGYSLLEIRLETGRKNQIRVHMKDIGHSIIGDKKYGAMTNPIGRLGLHAHILAFYHPVSGELMRFETEVPKKFSQLFK
ncbi:MAG: RluA family pseudouridine synthase [Syntrophomonadaceae bacterium]|mgnify:FL=1|jgi:23S rRNA pseudouridine1911/1915/1917 synthase|nr:RluA family pseudouridine synthase [Syntrophomonadaceae bacterium]NLX03038.1 RluA family pseudouridine synthase [Syntrophomonadaceae bacterium]